MDLKDYFYSLADTITGRLEDGEVYTCIFHGEDSDFVRFNRSAIRQPGTVIQRTLNLSLIKGQRQITGEVTLSGDMETDKRRLGKTIESLREKWPYLPEDPYLLYATDVLNSEKQNSNRLPERKEAVMAILKAARGHDLVGIYSAGGIYVGFANSLGQRNWFSSYLFHFDWSFYSRKDKAIKTSYAGPVWDSDTFTRKAETALERLKIMDQTPKSISPGRYRVYLSPVALYAILTAVGWGGFGIKHHRSKETPLIKMVEEGATLHPSVTIENNTQLGLSPPFQGEGFPKPERVPFIERGTYRDCLVSPRSAREYGVSTNGASGGEIPDSLKMEAGTLDSENILQELGTGIYVGNLWYLNYSDRPSCRITGMTRFATFWVENGVIQAPLNVMRFDESIYRMLGRHLVGLTREQELIVSGESYSRRSTNSGCVPGALVDDFTLVI